MHKYSTKFQIVSDLHIEKIFYQKKTLKNVITPSADNLIIAGDLGRCENKEMYKTAVMELCSMFQKVILVPGNHEYYCKGPVKLSMDDIFEFLCSLVRVIPNFIVLNNSDVTIDNVLIFGSTFWSYCPHQHYMFTDLYDKDLKLVNCSAFNKMHLQAVQKTEEIIEFATREKLSLLIVTHYAPSFKGTLDKKHTLDINAPAMGSPKNYMYCSSSEHLVENSAVMAWVYGHTGYNGIFGKLVTNQLDRSTGLKNAVLTLDTPYRSATIPSPVLNLEKSIIP